MGLVNSKPAMLRRYLPSVVPVALFCVAIVALHRLGGEFHLKDILTEFAAIAHWQVLLAVALTAGSYLVLTGYERLALGYVERPLPWAQSALTSFVAFAVGHNVGVAALSGGAIRYRMYTPLGLGAVEIARIVAFCTLTFALGASTLAGVSLMANAGEAASLLHSTTQLVHHPRNPGTRGRCWIPARVRVAARSVRVAGRQHRLADARHRIGPDRACRGGPRARERGALRAVADLGRHLLSRLRRTLHGRAGCEPAEPRAGWTRRIRIDPGAAAARRTGAAVARRAARVPTRLLRAAVRTRRAAAVHARVPATACPVDRGSDVDPTLARLRRAPGSRTAGRRCGISAVAVRHDSGDGVEAGGTCAVPAAPDSRAVTSCRVGGRCVVADSRAWVDATP